MEAESKQRDAEDPRESDTHRELKKGPPQRLPVLGRSDVPWGRHNRDPLSYDFNGFEEDTDGTDALCQAPEQVPLTGECVMRGVVKGTISQVKP
ncbi:hypothetical protein NQZ68_004409 [Dissostichus eleginoides]|nr:hypothetical protein NQZ68_004409 [Dissostichus eleginoides]